MTKDKILKAEYGSDKTFFKIGSFEVPCYVLNNGKRVISGRGMQKALGYSQKTSGSQLTQMLSNKAFSAKLESKTTEILTRLKNDKYEFVRPTAGGSMPKTYGYEATVLIDIADLLIEANKLGILTKSQQERAEYAEMIIRSVAKVGIIALIDEATGYQDIRKKDALQKILDAFISKELAAWVRRFPDEFYDEMFRLKGWKWDSKLRPAIVGRYTNDIVYSRLAPNLVDELKKKNPRNEKGQAKNKDHQWLTANVGHPALSQHLYAVIGLMRTCQTWESFMRLINRAFPKKGDQIEMFDN